MTMWKQCKWGHPYWGTYVELSCESVASLGFTEFHSSLWESYSVNGSLTQCPAQHQTALSNKLVNIVEHLAPEEPDVSIWRVES